MQSEKEKIYSIARRLSRPGIVNLLENACVECYIRESTEELREVLIIKIKDGTISLADVEEQALAALINGSP